MTLRTQRLVLTPVTAADDHRLWPLLSDPLTLWSWGEPFSRRAVEDWIEGSEETRQRFGLGRHLVHLKATGALVGDCGFFTWWPIGNPWGRPRIDAGWVIHRRHWRQGYATEAMRPLLSALFALGHAEAWAKMAVNNPASWRTAERLGFTRVGRFREAEMRWDPAYAYRLKNNQAR
jgi:RimJ/RimL family protein N-acetyltransferase